MDPQARKTIQRVLAGVRAAEHETRVLLASIRLVQQRMRLSRQELAQLLGQADTAAEDRESDQSGHPSPAVQPRTARPPKEKRTKVAGPKPAIKPGIPRRVRVLLRKQVEQERFSDTLEQAMELWLGYGWEQRSLSYINAGRHVQTTYGADLASAQSEIRRLLRWAGENILNNNVGTSPDVIEEVLRVDIQAMSLDKFRAALILWDVLSGTEG